MIIGDPHRSTCPDPHCGGFSMFAPPISNKLRERSDTSRRAGTEHAFVPSAPTKTAANQRTSPRAAAAIKYSAMREQLK